MKNNFKGTAAIGMLLLGMYSCKAGKPAMGTNTPAPVQETAGGRYNGNYILTAILRAYRTTGDSEVHFDLHQLIKKEGKLKPNQAGTGNDFSVVFTTAEGESVETVMIADPLNTWIEYTNDAGKLEGKKIAKQEEYISVRMNYQPNVKIIQISNNKHKNAPVTVLTIKD